MKSSRSALSTAGLAVFATLGVLLPRTAVARSTAPTWVQGAAFSTGSRVPTVTVTLSRPVAQGDLLVGWFSQYDAPEQVRVSDSVNGTWTRAPASLTFLDDTGDIALYYRENSQAASSGMTITVSASSGTYLQGTVADYSGVALAGSLDQITSARDVGTAVDTGATAAVGAGELVFAALVTGGSPGSVTPGSSQGVPYTLRAETSSGSSYEADITSSAAGGQHGTATLASATNWFAVCAVFHPRPATPPHSPSTPTGLEATSVASTRVALSWSPSTGNAAGYTVYRDGSVVGTTRPDTTTLIDEDVTGFTTYTYSVDAFDGVNGHSAPSAPLTITTAAASPEFIQGAAASAGTRLPSSTLRLAESVLAGDLLVGWFGQFGAPGEVHVADDVNGPWTRSVSTTWGGTGDIALFYRENSAPAPSGLVITVRASTPAYLQEAVADYRGVARAGALDQATVAHGAGTYASVGPTASLPAGELVVAAVLTGGQPGSVTPGSSQMVPYVLDVQNGSAASDLEDILSSAAGPQEGSLTLGAATNWFMVLATFHPMVTIPSTTSSTTTTTDPTTTTSSTSTSTTTSARPPTTITTIPGNLPPDCSAAAASPTVLWPPNRQFVNVSVAGVTDPDGDPVAITVTGITQDKPLNDGGQGNTCPDATGVGTATASLRAEREGTGDDGRVYHVSFAADDGRGGRCTGTVTVCVPYDHGQGRVCVDQGPLFDSTGPTCVGACTSACAIEMALAQPLCTGENVPPTLMQRLASAQELVVQAAGTSGKKKAKRLMRKGIKALKQAVGIAAKAAKKGEISPACAASVAMEFRNAKAAADRWLHTR